MRALLRRLLLWILGVESREDAAAVVNAAIPDRGGLRGGGGGGWHGGGGARAGSGDGGGEDFTGVKVLDVVAFNAEVEPLAVAFLCSWLQERGQARVGQLCIEVSYRFDVSTETAKRWILKHSAERAEFEVTRGLVSLRGGRANE